MKYKKVTRNGVPCVVVEQELFVNIEQLRANLARFRGEEAAARQKAEDTEKMIREVKRVAPDLLAASDAAHGFVEPKKKKD